MNDTMKILDAKLEGDKIAVTHIERVDEHAEYCQEVRKDNRITDGGTMRPVMSVPFAAFEAFAVGHPGWVMAFNNSRDAKDKKILMKEFTKWVDERWLLVKRNTL